MPKESTPDFSAIKAVGFDLDQTMYQPDPRIDNEIRNKIARHIQVKHPSMGSIEEIRSFYDEQYHHVGSATKILKTLFFEHPSELLYECLASAQVHTYLNHDQPLVDLLTAINETYYTFLITSSPEDLAHKKLEKIGVNAALFNFTMFGDSEGFTSKTDVQTYVRFLDQSPHTANEHVYIGDNYQADILNPSSVGMKTISVGSTRPDASYSVDVIYDIGPLLLNQGR